MDILRQIVKNKFALSALILLAVLYMGAIFADFFAPYHYDDDDMEYLWSSPVKVHFFDKGKGIFLKPFIYGRVCDVDKYYRRIYCEDTSQVYPVKFFTRGFKYKFFGIWETDRHFFGVEGAKIYILGADMKGRDLFSRILYGARVSLSIGIIGALISFLLGILVGSISGYYGGKVDAVLMRGVEMIMMIPGFYLMLALRASFPPNLSSTQVFFLLVVILSFIAWAGIARVIRGMAISLRERDYVYAARALGVSDFKIIVRHIVPHTFSYAIVAIMLSIPGYILGEAALSLIGLGIQEPEASWGNLLSGAMGIVNIKLYPWILAPGVFIIVATMCFNIMGEALRDIADPKRKIQI